jgi:uncharacterized protein YqcC (DUF446 family)
MTERPEFTRMADEIEAEMRALNAWQSEPVPQATIDAGGAFGLKTMAYTQWLQFVLVPRLREMAAGSFPVPHSSSVGTQAIREFDTWPEGSHLTDLLIALDRLVGGSR